MAILSIEHVVKKYGAFTALNDVSLTVEKARPFAIIGSVRLGEIDAAALRQRSGAHQRRKDRDRRGDAGGHERRRGGLSAGKRTVRRICMKTGMVFQHFNLFPHLTALKILRLRRCACAVAAGHRPRKQRGSCWPWWAWRARPRLSRAAFRRAETARGHCARRWRWSRRSCCSTSRPARWTRRRRTR